MPSFTRSARSSSSLRSSSPAGSTSTALRVSSERPMRRGYNPAVLSRRRRSAAARPRGRRRIRKLRLFALLALLAVLSVASFSVGLVTEIAGELPSLDPSRIHNQTDGHLYASNGPVTYVRLDPQR